jgi:hypothetical protein
MGEGLKEARTWVDPVGTGPELRSIDMRFGTSNIRWILERWDGELWTGLVWLRTGTSGGLL